MGAIFPSEVRQTRADPPGNGRSVSGNEQKEQPFVTARAVSVDHSLLLTRRQENRRLLRTNRTHTANWTRAATRRLELQKCQRPPPASAAFLQTVAVSSLACAADSDLTGGPACSGPAGRLQAMRGALPCVFAVH
jgi:hypothetical protein